MKKQVLAVALMFSSSAFSGIIPSPVPDPAVLQQIAILGKQLNEMKKHYQMFKDQYSTARSTLENGKSQLESMTKIKDFNSGHYGLGNLKNSVRDLQNRQWSPSNWSDALKNISGGNPQRYNQLVESYKKSHPEIPKETFEKVGASKEQVAQYQQDRTVNQAVVVQTTYAFNDLETHLKTVHEISSKIEQTENTKSAIDLNSRLLAEMAYIQIQQLKLQALMNQQAAQTTASTLSQTAEQVRFNQLPDER